MKNLKRACILLVSLSLCGCAKEKVEIKKTEDIINIEIDEKVENTEESISIEETTTINETEAIDFSKLNSGHQYNGFIANMESDYKYEGYKGFTSYFTSYGNACGDNGLSISYSVINSSKNMNEMDGTIEDNREVVGEPTVLEDGTVVPGEVTLEPYTRSIRYYEIIDEATYRKMDPMVSWGNLGNATSMWVKIGDDNYLALASHSGNLSNVTLIHLDSGILKIISVQDSSENTMGIQDKLLEKARKIEFNGDGVDTFTNNEITHKPSYEAKKIGTSALHINGRNFDLGVTKLREFNMMTNRTHKIGEEYLGYNTDIFYEWSSGEGPFYVYSGDDGIIYGIGADYHESCFSDAPDELKDGLSFEQIVKEFGTQYTVIDDSYIWDLGDYSLNIKFGREVAGLNMISEFLIINKNGDGARKPEEDTPETEDVLTESESNTDNSIEESVVIGEEPIIIEEKPGEIESENETKDSREFIGIENETQPIGPGIITNQ